MTTSLPIGDFSRATHLSIKTLRHYHRVGLLEPADVDQFTGHRRYTTDQIPVAQVIRRFRELDMPIEEIRGDPGRARRPGPQRADRRPPRPARGGPGPDPERGRRAAGPARTHRPTRQPAGISHRSVAAARAAAISAVVDVEDVGAWYQGALGELHATIGAQRCPPAAPPGGIYANELFTHERGQATMFIPCAGPVRPVGRVEPLVVPPAELAVIVHAGPHDGIDRAYGALATHVAQHALGVDGPIREYYLTGRHDTPDESAWRTEIGWPIFQTATG